MIVKISASGKSFKGLSHYVMHDPKADTKERVAWTHTHNLSNDDVSSAVNEMYLTAENAELLKQEAGIRAGGRTTENSAKHISLNWDPADNPSRDHMIKTSEHFLESMGWSEHQAIFVAHSDKAYKHVHIILNAIHPETGLHLNESYEHRRTQCWAAEYERAQDCIRCPQRLQDEAMREKSMPRNMWVAFQQNEKSFLRGEELLRQKSENELQGVDDIRNSEWKILREIQRSEREEFFADGKKQFAELRNSIYREVREEFRGRWNEYHEARRNGTDPEALRELKQGIIDDRKAVFEPRRDAACLELRQVRDAQYREILDGQRDQRQTLRWHQELGHDTSDFFNELHVRRDAGDMTAEFRQAAREVTHGDDNPRVTQAESTRDDSAPQAEDSGRGHIGAGLGSFAFSLFDSLFFDLTTMGSARLEPVFKSSREEACKSAAEESTKQREQTVRELDDEDWRHRSKALHGRE